MARRGRAVMLQGAGSNVGKSMIVAGLCRAARRRGLSVAPFKPQNMSNNAAVTADGGEIGRAQALQAQAAGLPPSTDMNPVLLKPETDVGAQVVLRGRRLATVRARDYAALKPTLLPAALESFERLRAAADLVIVEGAGAASEVNLRAGDIANMGFAAAADAPVALIGDIDRGGVIAQLVGARAVLDPEDAARVEGFLINKFRGDARLCADGYSGMAARTGWRGFGVLPWFEQAARLPAEDSEDLAARARARALGGRGDGAWAAARLRVAVPQLPRIANFDDLDPLAAAEGVALTMVPRGRALPGDADLLILPGSKSTRGDLAALRAEGWDVDILAHHRRGGRILGLCGGYQMLGRAVSDPGGVEGAPGDSAGLGLLDVATRMTPEKRLRPIAGAHAASGAAISGYEMHIGETEGDDRARPFLTRADGSPEGAISADGLVVGTYAHGLFAEDGFRAAFVAQMRGRGGAEGAAAGAAAEPPWRARVEATLDALADHLEAHLDVDGLFAIAR